MRAILAWGIGWCIGAVILALAFVVLVTSRAEAAAAILVLLVVGQDRG